MKNLKALCYTYSPNVAATRRHLGFFKRLSEAGLNLDVTFVLPDKQYDKVQETIPNVRFSYLWDRVPIKNRYIQMLLFKHYIRRYVGSLKDGDTVLFFNVANVLPMVVDKSGIRVFHERNEHPEAVLTGSKVAKITLDKYLECCRKVDGIFVITQSLKDYFIQQGVCESKVHVINMFVDGQKFEGVEPSEGSEDYIAYCGAGYNQKDGVDTLIKSFAIFNKKYPKVKLYIIGPKEDCVDYYSNVELINQLGISDSVVFTGVRPNSEIPQMLVNSKAVLLSRPKNQQTEYGFPNKLGEYLMSGVPAVVTRIGDIPSYLKDGENAMVAEPDNPEDFAEKLIWLFDHPKEAKIIGEKGKETAMKHFNYLTESKKVLDVIKEQNIQ